MSQIFRSFEANSGAIQRKGSEDLPKSSAPAVDQSNLGQAPDIDPTLVLKSASGLDDPNKNWIRPGKPR